MSNAASHVAIIGGGPAGLIAADLISAAGRPVTVYDRMPSLGRKFLMAGRGGLNLTHSEPFETFVTRYGQAAARLRPALEAFGPTELIDWAARLGQETFVGSSGRVFPRSLKASPLLRAWLARLVDQGVALRPRHDWRGWTADGALRLAAPDGEIAVRPEATILALGGGSWPRLGATGDWVGLLRERGVPVTPLSAANSGFEVAWSAAFAERFAGQPLKAVAFEFGGRRIRGEAMIADYGVEGGAIYALSAALREALATEGTAVLEADLAPDLPRSRLTDRLHRAAPGQSTASLLRKAGGLSSLAANLLREGHGLDLPREPGALARAIKATPIVLTATRPMDRAISTAGGVAFDAVGDDFMLRALPGVYAVGEMLDWDAPTGGYLLQACFATGAYAARALLAPP